MKKIILGLVVACCACLFAQTKTAAIDSNKLGFTNGVTEKEQSSATLPEFKFKADAPGTNTLIERSFENAPPLISHSLDDMLPITKDNNMCVSCHMPDVAEGVGATAVPKSHLFDFREDKAKEAGVLAEQRFDCTLCHVPQADAPALVKNNFKADFSRYNDSNTTSNLLDILNQGAKIE